MDDSLDTFVVSVTIAYLLFVVILDCRLLWLDNSFQFVYYQDRANNTNNYYVYPCC